MPDALYSKVLNLMVEAQMQAEPALLWREQHTARSRTGPGDLRLYWKLCFLGFRVSCILGFECVPFESHALHNAAFYVFAVASSGDMEEGSTQNLFRQETLT